MQAVILAGGAGTRLRPLTLNTPKPMIDVNGKPFLLYVIEWLVKCGVREFVLCIGYLPESFKEFFGDGSRFGIKIDYSVEREFIGTGGALKLAERYLRDEFIVVNGDTYLPIDYGEVWTEFKKAGKTGMIVLYDNKDRVAEPNVAVDTAGNICGYVKKEPLKRGNTEIKRVQDPDVDCRYIDAGTLIFKRSVLDLIGKDGFVALETDVYPRLMAKGELSGFITSQRYYDLGTPERLELIRKVLGSEKSQKTAKKINGGTR